LPSSDRFKQARNRWLRAIRRGKRECWERFLQASDSGAVWKSINAKPQPCAMPPILTSPSGEEYHTLEEKLFPSRREDTQSPCESIHALMNTDGQPESSGKITFTVCPKIVKRLLKKTSHSSVSGLDGMGWHELKIWFLLDATGLCQIVN
jgi:hypothetical protein